MKRRCIAQVGLVLALSALLVTGCNWRRGLWQMGLGSFATELTVQRITPRAEFLEVNLVGSGLDLTVYVPATEECAFVLKPEEPIGYTERGVAGRFDREGVQCDSVGFGDPLIRGARQPRSSNLRSSPVPRSQASFRVMHEDEEVIMLRGRFPQARRIAWAGANDSIAVVQNTSVCRAAIEGGVASMEYRASGNNTLTLVGREGLCRIVGLVIPRPGS